MTSPNDVIAQLEAKLSPREFAALKVVRGANGTVGIPDAYLAAAALALKDWGAFDQWIIVKRIARAINEAVETDRAEAASLIKTLTAEIDTLTKAGIIEVAIRNPSVADYMAHWEGRAEKAEAALTQAVETEREECAKCCEGDFDSEMRGYGDYFANAIRARSTQDKTHPRPEPEETVDGRPVFIPRNGG